MTSPSLEETAPPEGRLLTRLWLLPVVICLLLAPAIYNGFPLVFPDTGAYFTVAWGNHWTLDRSGFYGFVLRPLSSLDPYVQLWTGLILQAAAIGAVIIAASRQMLGGVRAEVVLAILVFLTLFTSLPWHSAQLMPDAFSGIAVLTVWLACLRNPSEPGAPILWLAAYLAGLMHYTHVALVIAAAAVMLLVQWRSRTVSPAALGRRAAVCVVVVLAIVGTQTFANGAFLKRWTPTPLGSMFFFARLHEDGLVQPWLAKHCGETPILCTNEARFPRDSQSLLWGDRSPFTRLVLDGTRTNSRPAFVAELKRASLGTIAERPFAFAASAISGGARQFVRFQALDDECPQVCQKSTSAVYGFFRHYRPALIPSLTGSRQLEGTMPKDFIRGVTTPVAVLSLVALPVLLWLSVKRRDWTACGLLAAVLTCLIVNALLAGALSDVHDRYQSRLVWLAPFAVLLASLRWKLRPTPNRG